MIFFETLKVKNDIYFTDVVTQAEAKMYAEQYNKYAKRKVGLNFFVNIYFLIYYSSKFAFDRTIEISG